MAALLAPKSSTSPDIPFHTYRPRMSISSIPSPSLSSPEESALGVLAQVAHELEPTACAIAGNYFTDANILPADLAESLVNMFIQITLSLTNLDTLTSSIHSSQSFTRIRFLEASTVRTINLDYRIISYGLYFSPLHAIPTTLEFKLVVFTHAHRSRNT